MRSRCAAAVAVVASLIALGACSAATIQPESDVQASSGSTPPAVIERARKALAEAGISSPLRLVSSEPAEWPNSGLGCPQRGLQYLQVITAGHALWFAGGDGRMHSVNVAGDAAIVCSTELDTTTAKNAAPAYRALNEQRLVETARKDLAKRLGKPITQVHFRNSVPMTWIDENLGCMPSTPDHASPRPVAGVRGLKLFLVSGDDLYTYHTDSTRAIPCPPIEAR